MAAALLELIGSRERRVGKDPQVTLEYAVVGATAFDDEDSIGILVETSLPQTYVFLSFILGGPVLLFIQNYRIKHEGNVNWTVEALYAKNEAQQIIDQPGGSGSLPGQASGSTYSVAFQFDTSGGTKNLKHSLQTMYSTIPVLQDNEGGPINVQEDSVLGVEVQDAKFDFSETVHLHPALMTQEYIGTLYNLSRGCTNDAPWTSLKGVLFNTGEALFRGVSGQVRGGEPAELTFKFSGSKNATGLTVGAFTGISKKGHEYLWAKFANAVEANQRIKRPVAVFVERVYEEENLDDLFPWR